MPGQAGPGGLAALSRQRCRDRGRTLYRDVARCGLKIRRSARAGSRACPAAAESLKSLGALVRSDL